MGVSSTLITGRVLGPDGAPVADAKLFISSFNDAAETWFECIGSSDHAGVFRIRLPKRKQEDWFYVASIAVVAKGYGCGFGIPSAPLGPEGFVIRLTRDAKVEGRVVDDTGRPVAGAKAWVVSVNADPKKEFTEAELREWPHGIFSGANERLHGALGAAATDKDGRFEIPSVGENRVVTVRIEGPGIATTECLAATKAMKPVVIPRREGRRGITVYGSPYTHVASPGGSVEGRVVGEDGTPLAGSTVVAWLDGPWWTFRAETSQDGRFRLSGLPTRTTAHLVAVPVERDFIRTVRSVELGDPGKSIVQDLRCEKGVVVTGVIRERNSGKPVSGTILLASPIRPGDSADLAESYWYLPESYGRAAEDGAYRIVAPPGRVYLSFMFDYRADNFAHGAGWEAIPEANGRSFIPAVPWSVTRDQCQAIIAFDTPRDRSPITKNLEVVEISNRGNARPIKVQ